MTAVPFDCSPMRDVEPGERRAVVADEGDVCGRAGRGRGAARASLSDAPDERAEHLIVRAGR